MEYDTASESIFHVRLADVPLISKDIKCRIYRDLPWYGSVLEARIEEEEVVREIGSTDDENDL